MKQPGRPRASLIITVINAPGRINRRRGLIFSKLSVRARGKIEKPLVVSRATRPCNLPGPLCATMYDRVPSFRSQGIHLTADSSETVPPDCCYDRRLISIIARNLCDGSKRVLSDEQLRLSPITVGATCSPGETGEFFTSWLTDMDISILNGNQAIFRRNSNGATLNNASSTLKPPSGRIDIFIFVRGNYESASVETFIDSLSALRTAQQESLFIHQGNFCSFE